MRLIYEMILNIIDGVLTLDECKFFINKINSNQLKDIDGSLASYQRLLFVDRALASTLEHRLSKYIPKMYKGLRITGLNDHFRCSKYKPGQSFGIHKDGINQDSRGNRSIATVNIFLNSDCSGGSTTFYQDDKSTILHKALPVPGRTAIFDIQIPHSGDLVTEGHKYLLRTDIMASSF